MGATKWLEWIYKLANGGKVTPPDGPTGTGVAVTGNMGITGTVNVAGRVSIASGTVAEERWTYKGGESFMPSGTSTAATIPADTDTVLIRAEGGDLYWLVNPGGTSASLNSPGYVAEGMSGLVGPLTSLTGLKLYSAAGGAKAHLEYFDSNS